jgi:hypothetical protein
MSMAIRIVLSDDPWRDAAEPWLRDVEAWRDTRPTVVLTPNRAQGFYLRGRLVEEGRPLLGVRFWTPSDARQFLRGTVCPSFRAATQDEQGLLARACAEKLLRGKLADDEATLRSVAQDPAPFLRGYDLLLGAGWRPSRDGAAYGKRLGAEFETALKKAKLTTQSGLHHLLREAEPPSPLPLARALIIGFNAAHWPLWDLLQAVCRFAESAEVTLDPPGLFGEQLDNLWIGSWESFTGSGYEIPETESADSAPLQSLADSYESGAPIADPDVAIHFLATGDLGTQVRAVTLQVLDYLRQPACTRLGIAFPEADALALGVAAQLRELGIPINDGLGALQPGPFETRPWQTWLELQEEPTVRRLIVWMRACEAAGRDYGLPSLPVARVAKLIDRALGTSMVDNLDFLAHQLETEGSETPMVADFLRKRVALPDESTPTGYLAATREALRRLGWNDLLALIPEEPPAALENVAISKRGFLAWLREIGDSRERVRPDGNHFYGKVHLLVYSQLAGQSWSHLILTGLNEGVWPRLFEAGAFGSRYELTELNARARVLNRSSSRQGAQGEGHETVAPGHGHCLLPIERHDLALRDLCAALLATREAVCLAARTLEQGHNLLPSDFFSHAWQVKTGRVLDDAMFRELAEKTAKRCHEHATLFPSQPADPQEIASTAEAFRARRNAAQPFGRYEFSHATLPAKPIDLTCKEWETAFAHPAGIWLSHVVGVEAWPEGNLRWKMSLGTWTHRWLNLALKETGDANGLGSRVNAAAERDWKMVQKRARDAGFELYPWWAQMWSQAQSISLSLAHGLAPHLAGKKALTEVSLPKSILVALPGADRADFALRGKLDLILLEPAGTTASAPELELAGCRAWVVDFKTGAASPISESRLAKGLALQIALYGLALQARGAEPVELSVLTPATELKSQLAIDKLLAMDEPFRTIDAMHRTGVFGQSPAEDDEHGHAPDYPMTTRSIPRDVLEAKWSRTHGGQAP